MSQAAGITYAEAGSGGFPALCLHGIGGNTENFRALVDGLSGERRIIAWNMPGFGGSLPLAETTFESLSAALARFMDELAIERAHIVGHSIGGMIAQDFALRQPERAVSLTLIGTTPSFGGRDETFKDEFLASRLKPLDEGKTMAELARAFVPEIVGPIASREAIASAVRSMEQVPADSYRAIIGCLVTFNRRDEQEQLTMPCCLIAGSHDQAAPARTMEKMAAKLRQAEYHLIEGAGHMIQMEAPDACNRIIRQFLEKAEERS